MDRYRTHSAISHQLADMVENYCQRKGITLFTDSDSDSISHVDRVFVNVMEEMLEENNDADDCRFYALCNEYRSNSLKKIPLETAEQMFVLFCSLYKKQNKAQQDEERSVD